jgi:hypothetical protein
MGTTTFSGPVVSNAGFQGSLTLADPLSVSAIKAADDTSALTFANSTRVVTVVAGLTMTDAKNIAVSATTGTKIGTATTQKLGFFNAAPVAQQATTGTTTGFTAGSGTASKSDSTFTGNSGSAAYTVGDIVLALKNLGFLAA